MEIFLISVTNLFTKTKQSKNSRVNKGSQCDLLRKCLYYTLYGTFTDIIVLYKFG